MPLWARGLVVMELRSQAKETECRVALPQKESRVGKGSHSGRGVLDSSMA